MEKKPELPEVIPVGEPPRGDPSPPAPPAEEPLRSPNIEEPPPKESTVPPVTSNR